MGRQRLLSSNSFRFAVRRLTSEKSLRGHTGSALSHIDSGINILSHLNEEERSSKRATQPSQEICVPRECLDVIFARLDAQKVQVGF